jgi:hypothetical protein
LKFLPAFAHSISIFKPAAEYPNSPETIIRSPGLAPFLDGILPLSENPIILQSIINSLDSFVSPPTKFIPNSLEDFSNPLSNSNISPFEYLSGIPIESNEI